jgi:hypothetical protein
MTSQAIAEHLHSRRHGGRKTANHRVAADLEVGLDLGSRSSPASATAAL